MTNDKGNSKVTPKEFYQELIIVKEDISDIKIMLSERLSKVETSVGHNAEGIKELKKRSDKWDIITNAILVPIVTVLTNIGISIARE